MMFRYFNLSLFQQVLCYAYSLPLALFFTFAFSPVGTWSWPLLFSLFVLLTVLGWTGLAFHLRRLDRLRRGSDATDVFLRQGKCVVGQIKRQTKAQLEWDILHDTARAMLYSPAFILLSAGITFAFMPDAGRSWSLSYAHAQLSALCVGLKDFGWALPLSLAQFGF